jgi:GNAT superfamily N-acetyltransferase
MQIDYLAAHPYFIPTLSNWFLLESPDFYRGKTWEDVAETFCERLNDNKIPLALVAFEGRQVCGTVSLLEESISIRKNFTPWLAGLHVCEEKRHRGIGGRLIAAVVNEARRLGVERLYIGVRKAERYYAELGWQTVERPLYYGEEIIIMRLDLC